MTKEEKISVLRVIRADYLKFDDANTKDKYDALTMVIKELEQEPKWIPVSERLPEDGSPVLIYAWNVHHVIARYDEFRTANGYKKTWVTADAWNGNTEIKDEIIAWMPLPKPYDAESEDVNADSD